MFFKRSWWNSNASSTTIIDEAIPQPDTNAQPVENPDTTTEASPKPTIPAFYKKRPILTEADRRAKQAILEKVREIKTSDILSEQDLQELYNSLLVMTSGIPEDETRVGSLFHDTDD